MADRLYKVAWPAGTALFHAKDAEQAVKRALEYLAQPESKRITATAIDVIADEQEKDRAL